MSKVPSTRSEQAISRDHEHVDKISTTTTLFVLAAIALLLYAIRLVLLPFVLSGLLAYICTPFIEWLTARSRIPRGLVAIGVFLILVLMGASIVYAGVPPLILEVKRFLTDLDPMIGGIVRGAIGSEPVKLFGQQMDAAQIAQAAAAGFRNWIEDVSVLTFMGGAAIGSAFGSFLTLILLFYFLVSGPRIADGLFWLVPPRQRPLIHDDIWPQLDPVLRRYFVGVIAVVIFAAVASYIGLGIFLELPHAPFLALLTGLLEAIPVVGPTTAAAIAGIVALQHATGFGLIIGYALYLAVLRLSIDQLFGPLVLGTAARVHPVLIIFCFLSGGILFGIVGVIMAVPVALIVKITLGTLYDERQGPNDVAKRKLAR
jgi:predicted PurR-regulated permease PerM